MQADRSEPSSTVTSLLERLTHGDASAEPELFKQLYAQLRDRAHGMMRNQPEGHTLQTTALVHEAWMRIGGSKQRASLADIEFLRLASSAMRSVLVDHARARLADKRGGGGKRIEISEADLVSPMPEDTLLAVDQSLVSLQSIDPLLARVAEMRLFAGLEHSDIALALGVSTRTIERAWKAARAWLQRELEAD